jgi:LmbE family N-acetylglucosaminyl deacetylase
MDFTKILTPLSALFSPSPLIKKDSLPFTVMLLSPHPDDESIVSTLALRLMHENNAHLVNVAVTLGSNQARKSARKKELSEACELLEMENIFLSEEWGKKLTELKMLLQKYQPQLIIAPHDKDSHPTHIKTGKLLHRALSSLKSQTTLVAWSEFWGQIEKPNLLVEAPTEIVDIQMRALEKHAGEIKRNPYHLRLPAWMMDNVRRGSEIIGGQGTSAPQIAFGVIYKIQVCKKGKFSTPKFEFNFLSSFADIGQIFKLILEAASGSRTKVK